MTRRTSPHHAFRRHQRWTVAGRTHEHGRGAAAPASRPTKRHRKGSRLHSRRRRLAPPWRFELRQICDAPRTTRARGQQPPLGRTEATCAALIPIAKSAAWWDSGAGRTARHPGGAICPHRDWTPISAGHRPSPVSQPRPRGTLRLLTWFEYAPADAAQFDDLVAQLRLTEEWRYVEREVDIRLQRAF